MIPANELRIGSYVSVKGLPVVMLTIGASDMEFIFSEFCQPIQLTPEILKKCGFKYGKVKGVSRLKTEWDDPDEEGDTEYWDKGKLTIVNWNKKGFILSNKSSFDHRVELTSLHQLQNIYFCLNQSELQIKL